MINSVFNDPYYMHATKAISEVDVNMPAHPEHLEGVNSFLDDCLKCPTKAIVAMKYVRSSDPRAPKFFYKNINLVKGITKYSEKIEKLRRNCKSDYPRTLFARKLLVKFKQVVFSKVVRRSKAKSLLIKFLSLFRF